MLDIVMNGQISGLAVMVADASLAMILLRPNGLRGVAGLNHRFLGSQYLRGWIRLCLLELLMITSLCHRESHIGEILQVLIVLRLTQLLMVAP